MPNLGINHIQLSAELIAILYPETLVEENGPGPGYPFLGKNLLSICFLVSYPDDEFIPDDQLVFLKKILAACKLSLNDIALINIKRTPVELLVLKKWFQPRIIFFWGIPSSVTGSGLNFPDMTISIWENIRILPVMQAELMSGDNPRGLELKKNLWISLKNLFNL
jgi:hypothetical protein